MPRNLGPTTKKVLLLLGGGLALGLARSPRQYFRVVKGIGDEWQKINREKLNKAIKQLYKSKLVNFKENPDGTTTLVINDSGKKKALTYQLDDMEIKKPKTWDHYWRIVIFDIPEKHKQAREALRGKLQQLGFYKLQKSIFVLPYECKNETDFIIEAFGIRPYVRYILAKHIDNEIHLKKLFDLI